MRLLVIEIIVAVALSGSAYAKGPPPPSPPEHAGAVTEAEAPLPVPNQTQTQTAVTADAGTGVADLSILRAVGGFGLVLSLIIIGFFAVRKFAPQYLAKQSGGKNLKIIETLPMGEKRSIALIEVGDKRFLVGNTPQQISLLTPISGSVPLSSEPDVSLASGSGRVVGKESDDQFRNIYEIERGRGARDRGRPKAIPEDVRAKMRQLREALEH